MIFLLHFLVVTATLLSLASGDEGCHILEDLVCPSEVLEDEVATVDLQEPVIPLVLLHRPVALLDVLLLLLPP